MGHLNSFKQESHKGWHDGNMQAPSPSLVLQRSAGTPSPQAASWVLTVICIPRTRKSVCQCPRSGLSSRSTGPTAFPTHLRHASKEEVSLTLNLLQPTSQRASPPSTQLQNLARAWTLLSSPLTSKSHAWYPPYN
ncbi:uncharacterized protein LOC144616716 [Panthera onca]